MVARELAHRRLRLAARVTERVCLWCRAWLGTHNIVWATRAVLILGLVSALGCTQSLTAIESTNASGGIGSSACINKGCNFSDPSNPQCCEGARCNAWGYCVAVDGGTNTNSDAGFSVLPGQACTGESSCVPGFRCQSIGNYKICVSNTSTVVESLDGWHCQRSSDCSSLYCDSNSSCAVGVPCKTRGDSCTADKDCCSDRCDGTCASSGDCSVHGDSCYSDGDCCTHPPGMNSCVWLGVTAGSRCLASTCRHESDVCTTSNQCCRGQCSNSNRCQSGSAACLTYGLSCSEGDECCSDLCRGSGYQWSCQKLDGCQPVGEPCNDDSVCCSKTCTDGHCASSTSGTGACLNEGEPCLGVLGQCCSPLSCIYDWFSTVSRCSSLVQGSCRATGDACAFEAQCCNGARCVQNSSGDFKCGDQKQ